MTDRTAYRLMIGTLGLSIALIGLGMILSFAALMGHTWAHLPLAILCGSWALAGLPIWGAAWREQARRNGVAK